MKTFRITLFVGLISFSAINGLLAFIYFAGNQNSTFLILSIIGFMVSLCSFLLVMLDHGNILFKTNEELNKEKQKHIQAIKAYNLAEQKLINATLKQNGSTIFKQKRISKDPGSRPEGTTDAGPR